GRTDELAAAGAWLVSERASSITGAVLRGDGGFTRSIFERIPHLASRIPSLHESHRQRAACPRPEGRDGAEAVPRPRRGAHRGAARRGVRHGRPHRRLGRVGAGPHQAAAGGGSRIRRGDRGGGRWRLRASARPAGDRRGDRKSTRLDSSHQIISYAVFCLKKKKKQTYRTIHTQYAE